MVKSTRNNTQVPISQAILQGLSPDGGLFVFDTIPTINTQELIGGTYQDTAKKVFSLLLDNFSQEAIDEIVDSTYTKSSFQPSPITLTTCGNHSYLNLYHGETFAFKDMALSVLPKLVQEAARIENSVKQHIIVTATSGDTGSAALAGFQKDPNNHIFVLYPTNGVSPFQEKQMHQFTNDHAKVFPVEGNFDDCQTIVKRLFQSTTLKNARLISANSINIGRLIPQITYYVHLYVELLKQQVFTEKALFNVVVPTGNFGNIYAAYIAKQMGIPIKELIIASNQNNVLYDFFHTGTYSIHRPLFQTISPSMDIIISSNLERYLYDVVGKDSNKLNQLMNTLQTEQSITLDIIKNHSVFHAYMASEQETLDTISNVYHMDNLLIDPHTAVGRHAYNKFLSIAKDETHTVIVATASPYKFSKAMTDALHLGPMDSIDEMITALSHVDSMPMDSRIQTVLDYSLQEKHVYSKSDVYSIIQEMVGVIDDH